MKSQILYQLSQLDQEKVSNLNSKSKKPINKHQAFSNQDLLRRREKASEVLDIMREQKIMPISVQQRVIGFHPKTRELRTAKILSAAPSYSNG